MVRESGREKERERENIHIMEEVNSLLDYSKHLENVGSHCFSSGDVIH